MASLLTGGGLGAEAPSKVSSAIYTDSRPCFKQWQLTLGVIQAKDLKVADTFTSDPFVNIELEGCLARTRVGQRHHASSLSRYRHAVATVFAAIAFSTITPL